MAVEDNNEQLELGFPDPETFDSYDEIDSEEGQAELPEDSFDASVVTGDQPEEGCCVR